MQSASNPDVLLSALHKLGPGDWQRSGESEQAAAERLGRSIEVARVGTSYEVAITARAANPNLAAQDRQRHGRKHCGKSAGEGNAGDVQRIAVLKRNRSEFRKNWMPTVPSRNPEPSSWAWLRSG